MLKRLDISNYALIENANLRLNKGFTVITGETGAGKSILLKALNLLLGERADTSVLRQSEKKCILEAVFDIEALSLNNFFKRNELDYDKECIVRREFNSAGKSRAFINDTPVQLALLKSLGNELISVHTQHQTLDVLNKDFQLDVLDHFAGIEKIVRTYTSEYQNYIADVDQLVQLKVKDKESRKEKDYLSFLLKELDEANLDGIDIEKLKSQTAIVENSEKIQTAIRFAQSVFENESYGPTVGIKTLLETFEELKEYDQNYADLYARILSVKIELDDVESEVSRFDDQAQFSNEEALAIKEKLEQINALSFKHNLTGIEDLIALQASIRNELNGISTLEDTIVDLEKSIAEHRNKLTEMAKVIHEKRKKSIPSFVKGVKTSLSNLAMPDAELSVDLKSIEKLTAKGMDDLEFLFKTNLGGAFLPIRKVASGGELSRLMLVILSILSETKNLPTLIFDEIDTGVSGEVAAKIANEFDRMGKKIQVIAITHLAQVAGKGHSHLHVTKGKAENKTITSVTEIKGEGRINILAQMISGEEITAAARENAANLLSQN